MTESEQHQTNLQIFEQLQAEVKNYVAEVKNCNYIIFVAFSFLKRQQKFTCSKSMIERIEKGVKYVHKVSIKDTRTTSLT